MTSPHVTFPTLVPVSELSEKFRFLMMDSAVREIIFLLAFLVFLAVGITGVDATKKPRERHLFVQRRSPLPGSPRKLLTVEREALDGNFPSSDQQDAHKILSRVRRSVNPDTSPKVNEVGFDKVIQCVKVCCKLRPSANEWNFSALFWMQYFSVQTLRKVAASALKFERNGAVLSFRKQGYLFSV